MVNWKDVNNLRIFRALHLQAGVDFLWRYGTTMLQGNLHEVARAGRQGAPAAKTTSTTLTAAELLGKIITGNQGAAGAATYTLPLGADLEKSWRAQKSDLRNDDSFDFHVINLSTVAAEDITVATNTGWTVTGMNLVVESNEATAQKGPAGHFRVRRTGDGTFTLYRIA